MKKILSSLLSVVVFLVCLGGSFYFFRKSSTLSLDQAVEMDWRLLADLDYVTGKATPELSALDGREVKIPGFMVPLEDNQKKVVEFLLVPSPQACIHVPPPPPNQMVLVQMEGMGTDVAFGPIWVYGTLVMKPKKHQFGESSFQLVGKYVEAYR